MKRLLLDTHALLWWLANDAKLGKATRDTISDDHNQVYVSAASGWEVSIKRALGKLTAPDDLEAIIEEEGFVHLPVTFFHGEQAGSLPRLHGDPFDRLLVAQAQAEGLTIVTSNTFIPQYGVRVLDAGR